MSAPPAIRTGLTLFLALSLAACDSPERRAREIDQRISSIAGLTTDKTPDLEPVRTSPPVEETLDEDGEQFVCTTASYSLTRVPDKFVALNPNADVLWPGSLIQGRSMANGVLDPIPVSRAPGTVTLTMAAGGSEPFFQSLESPSLSSATQAINEILAQYEGATPAKFSYMSSAVHSMEQLAVTLNANVSGVNWDAAAALRFNKEDKKNRMLLQFTQEYFTMAFDPPQGAADVYAPSVSYEDLAPYVGDDNPPVYVASVTYGRIFYMLFESTQSLEDLRVAVSGSYSGGIAVSGDASIANRKIINNATVRSYGLGGNAEGAIAAATGSKLGEGSGSQFDQIKDFLASSANFSSDDPGVPISYTMRNLTDASHVKLALTTEYEGRDCKIVQKGCDGLPGSNKVVDACGVCGGNGATCRSCAATTRKYVRDGVYVKFFLPAAKHGTNRRWDDGSWDKYIFPYCHEVIWKSVAFQCRAGNWTRNSGSIYNDIGCIPRNSSQSGLEIGVD